MAAFGVIHLGGLLGRGAGGVTGGGTYGLPLWPARWTVAGIHGTAIYELTVEYRLGGRGLVTVVSLWTTAPAEAVEPRPPWLEPLIWRVLHPDDD